MDNLHDMANPTAHHHNVSPSYVRRSLQLVKDHDVANHNVRYKSEPANRFLQFLQLHANLTKLTTNFHTRKLLGMIPKHGKFTPLSPSTQMVAALSVPSSQPTSSSMSRSSVLHNSTRNGKHHRPYNHGNMQHNSSSSVNNIDPRYGVEKRLVPTGPNPLHN